MLVIVESKIKKMIPTFNEGINFIDNPRVDMNTEISMLSLPSTTATRAIILMAVSLCGMVIGWAFYRAYIWILRYLSYVFLRSSSLVINTSHAEHEAGGSSTVDMVTSIVLKGELYDNVGQIEH